jgi:hypothetical protein
MLLTSYNLLNHSRGSVPENDRCCKAAHFQQAVIVRRKPSVTKKSSLGQVGQPNSGLAGAGMGHIDRTNLDRYSLFVVFAVVVPVNVIDACASQDRLGGLLQ